MIRLSKEQVILLHERLIEATGGGDGIRDDGMLDSALANPFQSFGDEELYPSVQAKVAKVDKKQEYQDNTDRIEVERIFSLSKRCYGMIGADVSVGSCRYLLNHQTLTN